MLRYFIIISYYMFTDIFKKNRQSMVKRSKNTQIYILTIKGNVHVMQFRLNKTGYLASIQVGNNELTKLNRAVEWEIRGFFSS